MNAFWQWKAAKKITRTINLILDIQYGDSDPQDGDEETSHPRPPRWTLDHGFYAAMGGFAFDTQDLPESQKFLPKSLDRVSLEAHALYAVAIMTPELLPRLRTEEIRDKSKANGLAKTIACLQAIWFTAQCMQRIIQGLAISILELNTVCCFLFIKPLK